MEWEKLDWENLCSELIENLPDEPGAYAIRWAPKGKGQQIQRVFGPDTSGILCFGQTGRSLKIRLRAFYRSADEGKQQHAEGISYHCLRYAERLPLKHLQIGCKSCNYSDPDRAKKRAIEIESNWFSEYEENFGELPPLNRKKG